MGLWQGCEEEGGLPSYFRQVTKGCQVLVETRLWKKNCHTAKRTKIGQGQKIKIGIQSLGCKTNGRRILDSTKEITRMLGEWEKDWNKSPQSKETSPRSWRERSEMRHTVTLIFFKGKSRRIIITSPFFSNQSNFETEQSIFPKKTQGGNLGYAIRITAFADFGFITSRFHTYSNRRR